MEKVLTNVRIIWLAFGVSIVLYVVIAVMIPSTITTRPIVGSAISLLAVITIGAVFFAKSALLKPAEHGLAAEPASAKAATRWQTAYLIAFTLTEVVALYGLVLHFLGFPLTNVLPFLGLGLALLGVFAPRVPQKQ